MILDAGQIIGFVVSILGLLLNGLVGGLVTFGLRLRTNDLILIAMIALTDSLFYLNNILRIILIMVDYLKVDESSLNPEPTWWCPYDTTLTLTTIQSSIEFVAILSLMRYLAICHQKKLSFWAWFPISAFSVISSAGLSLGNAYYEIFHWSQSKLFCLPIMNPFPFGIQNRDFFISWFSIFMGRFWISLIVIVFAYFKVATAYRRAITQHGIIALKERQEYENYSQDTTNDNVDGIAYNEANKIEELTRLNREIRSKKILATLKLMGAALAYVICITPDNVIIVFYIQGEIFKSATIYTVAHVLMCCGGLVNALFVLFSHDPTRRLLYSMFRKEEEEEEDTEYE